VVGWRLWGGVRSRLSWVLVVAVVVALPPLMVVVVASGGVMDLTRFFCPSLDGGGCCPVWWSAILHVHREQRQRTQIGERRRRGADFSGSESVDQKTVERIPVTPDSPPLSLALSPPPPPLLALSLSAPRCYPPPATPPPPPADLKTQKKTNFLGRKRSDRWGRWWGEPPFPFPPTPSGAAEEGGWAWRCMRQ
jgi:hypothetical protein